MNICFDGEILETCYVWMYDHFSGFIKFWPSERNTENTMSHLYFNEESDYSEENTCDSEVFRSNIFYHRKKLNIFTLQLPIYYIPF